MKNHCYVPFIERELALWPGVRVEFETNRKHCRAVLHYAEKSRFVIFPMSPGDKVRGPKRMVIDMRKELRTLGAVKETLH